MRIDETMARRLLERHDHGILMTVHPEHGTDGVPVVFAVIDDHLAVPIDLVKPKSSTRLQRERNLEADPRSTLLLDHWDAQDWSRLWWVRARLRWVADPPKEVEESLAAGLVEEYEPYADRPFARLLVFRIRSVTGWAASDHAIDRR
ncbi:MAG: pyridoxamine 5'-phosphate oxidase family protein [Actinomycetota bacterium]